MDKTAYYQRPDARMVNKVMVDGKEKVSRIEGLKLK
jgi:hypothetical protein